MAVYTNLSHRQKAQILNFYNLSQRATFSEISEGMLNTNYLINDENKKYVFRLLEGKRDVKEELKELNFLDFLKSNDIVCPQAEVNRQGLNHMFVENKMGVLFNFVAGDKVKHVDMSTLAKIGKTLGRLHTLSKGKSITRRRKIELEFFYKKIKSADLEQILQENFKLVMDTYKSVCNYDFDKLPSGIIHNDIFPDNVFDGKELALIDFNDCMTAPFLVDVGIIINFWIKTNQWSRQKENEAIRTFLEAYEKERKLTVMEKSLFKPMLTKVALTFIFLRINKFHVEDNGDKNIEVKRYQDLLILLKDQ
ncbi:MAG: homoserine kinase [Lentisphaeria bacterium]|nr:homoserine kinase [Lentisphaeria bacterium]